MLGLGLGIQKAKVFLSTIGKYFLRVQSDGGTLESRQQAKDEIKRVQNAAGEPSLSMIASGYKGLEDIDNTQGFLGTVYSMFPEQQKYQLFDINGVQAQGGTPATYLQVDAENNQFTVLANADFTYVFVTANDNKLFAGKQYTVNVTYTSNGNTNAVTLYGQNNLQAGDLVEGENTKTIIMDSDQNGNDVRLRFRVAGNDADITFSNISINYESDGDFDFSRGSDATRVDENGFVKSVQLLDNTELVNNGAFDATTTGVELIANGDFEEISANEELTYTNFSTSDNLVQTSDFNDVPLFVVNSAGAIEGDDTVQSLGIQHSIYGGSEGNNLAINYDFSTGFVTTPGTGWEDPNGANSITNGVLRLNADPNATDVLPGNNIEQSGIFTKNESYYIDFDIAAFQLSPGAKLKGQIGYTGYELLHEQSSSVNTLETPIVEVGNKRKTASEGNASFDGVNGRLYMWIANGSATDYIEFNSIEVKKISAPDFENLRTDVFQTDVSFNSNYGGWYDSRFIKEGGRAFTTGANNAVCKLINTGYDRALPLVLSIKSLFRDTSSTPIPSVSVTLRGENNAWSTTANINNTPGSAVVTFPTVSPTDLQLTTSTNIYIELNTSIPSSAELRLFENDVTFNSDNTAINSNISYFRTSQPPSFVSLSTNDFHIENTQGTVFNGKAYMSDLPNSVLFRANKYYHIHLYIPRYNSGSVTFGFEDGATDIETPSFSSSGHHYYYMESGSGGGAAVDENITVFLKGNSFDGEVELYNSRTFDSDFGWTLPNCNVDFVIQSVIGGESYKFIRINNTSGSTQTLVSNDFSAEGFLNYQIEAQTVYSLSNPVDVTLDGSGSTNFTIDSLGTYKMLKEINSSGTTTSRLIFSIPNNTQVGIRYAKVLPTNLDGVNATYHIDSSVGAYIDQNALQLDYRPGQSTYLMYGLSNSGPIGDSYIDNRVYKAEIQGTGNINFRSSASGPNSTNIPLTLPASHYFTWTGGDTNDRFQIGQTGTSGATVDSVSLKKVDPNNEWKFGTASGTIFNGEVILDAGISNNRISQTGVMLIGNDYKLSVEITEIAPGDTLEYLNDGSWHLLGDSVGVNEVSIINTTSTHLYLRNNNGAQRIKFDNVSLEEITNLSDWTFSNNWGHSVANGTAVGNGTSGYLYQGISVTPGKKYRISFEVKNYVSGRVWPVINGSVNTDGTEVTANGVYTEDLIADLGANGNVSINAISFNGEIDNVSVLELSQDTDIPRIDYTYGSPALLLEPQRTNLFRYSNVFTGNLWNKSNCAVIPNYETSPEGIINATQVTTVNSPAYVGQSISLTTGNVYTVSAFVKRGTLRWVRLSFVTSSETGAWFDLENGVVGSRNANSISHSIEDYGNGWYRITNTFNAYATGGNTFIGFSDTDTGTTAVAGQTVSIYGFQVEEGSYATSYIPTNSSTVTRLKDICKTSADKYIINNTEGVLYAEFLKTHEDTDTFYLISLNNLAAASDDDSVAIGLSATTNFYLRVRAGGVNALIHGAGTYASDNEYHKVALKYKSGECAAWVNGVEVISTTDTFTFSKPLNNISFDYNGNNILPYYGHVRALHYFDEALTDDQLQALTT